MHHCLCVLAVDACALTLNAAWRRFSLEGRIMELEAGHLEHHVRAEDHAGARVC